MRLQLALLTKQPDLAKTAIDAYQKYSDALLPFLENAANTTTTDHQRLMELVKHPIRIDVHKMRHEKQKELRATGLQKFRIPGGRR